MPPQYTKTLVKQKNTAIIVLLITLTLVFVVWSYLPEPTYEPVYGTDGVWNLQDFDFESGNARLDGLVRYIPDALLTPKEFALREQTARTGRPESASQFATSKITILVPDDGYYSFAAPSVNFSERLYVNGRWFSDVGSPGKTEETTVHDTAMVRFIAKAENGVIELVRQSASFVGRDRPGYDDMTSHAEWLVGLPGAYSASVRDDTETAIVAGCYLALFFVHLALYILLQRYQATFCVAFLCLTWFLRTGVTGPKLFSTISPWLPWTVKLHIEYLSFPATAILILMLMDTLFPGLFKKQIRYIVHGTSVAAILATLFLLGNTEFMRYSLTIVQVVYSLAIVYTVVALIRKLRSATPEQKIYIAGIAVISIPIILDIILPNTIAHPAAFGSERAMLVFVFYSAASVFLSTMRRIEEAKAQEQQLAAENAALDRVNRMKTEFLENISHELKTPLTIINNNALDTLRELRREQLNVPEMEHDQKHIYVEGQRLIRMVSQLLDVTAIEAGRQKISKEPLSLATLLIRVADMNKQMLSENGNRAALEIPDGLPDIAADADAVERVLVNLISNTTRHNRQGVITISLSASNGWQEVRVTDTGEGISPEVRNQVFLRYVERENKVTGRSGMGLYICKKLIHAHGGEIGIDSYRKKGAAVWFRLPANEWKGKIL